jgi:hypothetical protein
MFLILRIVLLHGTQARLFLSFPLPLLPLGFFTLSSQARLLFLPPLLLSSCLLFPRRALAQPGCFRLPHRSLCCTLHPEQIRFQSSSLTITLLFFVPRRHLKSCAHFGFEKQTLASTPLEPLERELRRKHKAHGQFSSLRIKVVRFMPRLCLKAPAHTLPKPTREVLNRLD